MVASVPATVPAATVPREPVARAGLGGVDDVIVGISDVKTAAR